MYSHPPRIYVHGIELLFFIDNCQFWQIYIPTDIVLYLLRIKKKTVKKFEIWVKVVLYI